MHKVTTLLELDDEQMAVAERLAASNNRTSVADYLTFVMMNAVNSWVTQLRTPEAQYALALAEKDRDIAALRAERDAAIAERNDAVVSRDTLMALVPEDKLSEVVHAEKV